MNKLLFKLDIDFGEKITLIANNHRDLEDYLRENYDWFWVNVYDEQVAIREREGYDIIYGTLEWVKSI